MPWISKRTHEMLKSRHADAEKAEAFLRENGFSYGVYGGTSWVYDGRCKPGENSAMARELRRVYDHGRYAALGEVIRAMKLKPYSKLAYGTDVLEADLKIDRERRVAKEAARAAKADDEHKAAAMARLKGK